MRKLLLTSLITMQLFASTALEEVTSFEADFSQSITDEKEKVLIYNGHIVALKPQNARWSYIKPIKKDVFINDFEVTIIEPEIEQVIIKRLESNFDFFKIISNAKKIDQNTYVAYYRDTKFTIVKKNALIESISYLDEFENRVKITFENQKQNHEIEKSVFIPKYSMEFDIIKD
ncbi:LolA-like outer membrane lipoprotein chaperone [Sulfurimonas sp.]|uniref:LolA-like outer membrane lipoprotein chaperone n=1 Tax=Sulfurimonas sp. TaxID=2022749 RepID=UPI002A362FF8|nr:LolA-like outer membrane lipoprotein chaperone [Sulfurimonas sp.]MDY0124193.1 LolA-like outer membrane lipoprotein chaperone [Sulfurimonas sp.]